MREANTPKFDSDTRVLTLPEVRGVTWKVNGQELDPGTVGPLPEGDTVKVVADLAKGVRARGETEWTFGSGSSQD